MPCKFRLPLLSLLTVLCLTGCITPAKLDSHVSKQFNNTLPKSDKQKNPDITVINSIPSHPSEVSHTEMKSKMLPLLIYWTYERQNTCTLNPQIGVNYFRKVINQQSGKLGPKLNGRQLELKVEQIPGGFAIIGKEAFILFLIHWVKVYVQPDSKDLVVSYRLLNAGNEEKTGKITVPNRARNQGLRYFQSWKSAATEFLGQYNTDMTEMGRSFVNDLIAEL